MRKLFVELRRCLAVELIELALHAHREEAEDLCSQIGDNRDLRDLRGVFGWR